MAKFLFFIPHSYGLTGSVAGAVVLSLFHCLSDDGPLLVPTHSPWPQLGFRVGSVPPPPPPISKFPKIGGLSSVHIRLYMTSTSFALA